MPLPEQWCVWSNGRQLSCWLWRWWIGCARGLLVYCSLVWIWLSDRWVFACNFNSMWSIRARFLPLARSKLRLCSANHRAGYFSNLACDWLSIVWAYSEQETENWPRPVCVIIIIQLKTIYIYIMLATKPHPNNSIIIYYVYARWFLEIVNLLLPE